MNYLAIPGLFYVDKITNVMFFLIAFISCIVFLYAKNYMQGEKRKIQFLLKLIMLSVVVSIMVAADNIILLLSALGASHLLLISLMQNNLAWPALRASSRLTARSMFWSFLLVIAGFLILYLQTNQVSIHKIAQHQLEPTTNSIVALAIIFIGVMLHSALWPFNRWLLSSLNAPTPVSAMMHAGIINGGGFLLIRLAPLYLKTPNLLSIMFGVGVISALLGTLFKLTQTDYKRMLACSTMAQMGFMVMQCGLGLFTLAMAHICWHGIFKAYLFLTSGSAAQGEPNRLQESTNLFTFILALLIGGVFGGYVFGLSSSIDANIFIKILVFIAGTQTALTILNICKTMRIAKTMLITAIVASLYGLSVRVLHGYLDNLSINHVQDFNILHAIGLLILLFAWLFITFRMWLYVPNKINNIIGKFYVFVLNAGQPHDATITTSRHSYNY